MGADSGGGGGEGVQGTWPPGARAHSAGRKQRQGWGALPSLPTRVVSDLFLPPATMPRSHRQLRARPGGGVRTRHTSSGTPGDGG